MNILLQATSTQKNLSKIDENAKLTLTKIRGCSRNEDCVYLNDDSYIVYEIIDNDRATKEQFISDLQLFLNDKISRAKSEEVYTLIEKEHHKVKASDTKDASFYAKTKAEEIALEVLRKEGNCDEETFKRSAFEIMLDNKKYERKDFLEAVINFA